PPEAVGQHDALRRVVRLPDPGRPGPARREQRAPASALLRGDRRSRGGQALEPRGAPRAPRGEAGRPRREDEGEDRGGAGELPSVPPRAGGSGARAPRGPGRSAAREPPGATPHPSVPGLGRPLTVPLAAFKFAHDGPSIERPPARVGEHTDEVLASVGYTAEQIAALRRSGAIA